MASRFIPSESLRPDQPEAKKELYLDQISALLDENNLAIKHLPTGPNSLMRSISDALYFTPAYHEHIHQFIMKHLKSLIATNRLPTRLSMFQGNNMLWKDYSSNPNLPGFDKINLELVSSLFKFKIIVYHMTDDHYLSSTIINHKFEKAIEIVRTMNNQYHPVHTKDFISKAGFCQNIVLNIISLAFTGGTSHFRNFNNENYINLDYENWVNLKNKAGLEERPVRSRHKKSLSDGFDKQNLESMGEQQMKFYNMFMNVKPPDDFITLLRAGRKDTADSNLARNVDLGFMEEPWFETPPKMEYAIKNYQIPNSSLSSQAESLKEIPEVRIRDTTSQKKGGNHMFFHENLSLAEIEKMEVTPQQEIVQLSPVYYLNTPPPGLTPTRYPQKSAPMTDMTAPQTTDFPNIKQQQFQTRSDGIQNPMPQMNYMYGGSPERQNQQMPYSPLSPQAQFGSLYLKRTGLAKSLSLTANSDEFQGQEEMLLFQQQRSLSQMQQQEKKKPIILEESMQRYAGRLKFFDENKNYGFIIMDDDGSDIFVHYDDLAKANINKELLKTARMGNVIKLTFSCMKYVGKYDKSRKATDIELIL
jgi:hypothetical protein